MRGRVDLLPKAEALYSNGLALLIPAKRVVFEILCSV